MTFQKSLKSVDAFLLHYEGGAPFRKTVESLRAQDYPALKLVISDNESRSEAARRELEAFEAEWGIEVRRRVPGSGSCYPHYAVCIPEIRSPYVIFCHGDDLYAPSMIRKQVEFLEAHPEVDAVLTGATAIGPNDEPLWPIPLPTGLPEPVLDRDATIREVLRNGNSFFVAPSALFRSDVFERIGTVRAELLWAGDLEYWMRILLGGRGLGYLREPLLGYRMSLSQGSSGYERKRTGRSEFFDVMDEVLPRVQMDQETLDRYEGLKRLDDFQARLNRIALGEKGVELDSSVSWLLDTAHPARLRSLGAVDRLRVRGGGILKGVASSPFGPPLARRLIDWTDLRTSPILRWVVDLKRRRKAQTEHS